MIVSTPQRIQLRRIKGWRKPPDTVTVSRGTRWGNPYKVVHGVPVWFVSDGEYHWDCADDFEAHELAVACYEAAVRRTPDLLVRGVPFVPRVVPSVVEVVRHLRGKDLACWCAPRYACHADALLRMANGPWPL